jgi:hypothetical protein
MGLENKQENIHYLRLTVLWVYDWEDEENGC